MSYVAGLDGGGTKTSVCVISQDGKEHGRKSFGAMNLNGGNSEQVQETLKASMAWLFGNFGAASNFAAICIGSAGVSNPKAIKLLTKTVKDCGYNGKLLLKGDHETAFAGALAGRDGAVLIAGTGSICVGVNGTKTSRAGGYGHIIDDEGSGYAIGRDILSAVANTFDARSRDTVLRKILFNHMKCEDLPQLIQFIYSEDTTKKDIAALSFLLDEGLINQDSIAFEIADKASKQLFYLAKCVINELKLQNGEIAFLGSVLQNCLIIREKVEALIKKEFIGLTITKAEFDAAYGACLLALKSI